GILAAWPGIWVAAAHPWTQASRAICLDSRLSSLDAGGGDRRPRACQLRSPAPLDGRSHPPGAETGQARSTTDGLAPASLPFQGPTRPHHAEFQTSCETSITSLSLHCACRSAGIA